MAISTQERIARSVARSRREVFLRSDFEAFGTPTRISRGLNALVSQGRLVRLGYGVYAKARLSSLTGKPIARKTLEELAAEAFDRLGIEIAPGAAATAYASGASTQVPGAFTIVTPGRRVSRKLGVGNRQIQYEKPQRRAA